MTKLKCVGCDTVTTSLGATERHIGGEKIYVCPDCGDRRFCIKER